MNVTEARYANTRKLVAICGGVSAFAVKLGKSQSQVSQIAGENPVKGIGNKVAAEIETAFGMPKGWLDRESAAPEISQQEMQLLDLFRGLSDDGKAAVELVLRGIVSAEAERKQEAQPRGSVGLGQN